MGWRMAGLAGETISHVIGGGILGWLLDSWLDTDYWIIVGLLAGIATGLLTLVRGSLNLNKQLDRRYSRRSRGGAAKATPAPEEDPGAAVSEDEES